MRLTWNLLAAGVLVIGLGTAGCGGDSPSSPSTPGSSTPNPNAPHIGSLSPGSPTAKATAQTITVTGDRFAAGLTMLLDAPNGVWTTYSGSAITVQSPTSFTGTVMLDKVGVWDITVHSADGLESNEVQFSVVAP